MGKLACDHRYHVDCIHQWLRQKNWCPICKASVSPHSEETKDWRGSERLSWLLLPECGSLFAFPVHIASFIFLSQNKPRIAGPNVYRNIFYNVQVVKPMFCFCFSWNKFSCSFWCGSLVSNQWKKGSFHSRAGSGQGRAFPSHTKRLAIEWEKYFSFHSSLFLVILSMAWSGSVECISIELRIKEHLQSLSWLLFFKFLSLQRKSQKI